MPALARIAASSSRDLAISFVTPFPMRLAAILPSPIVATSIPIPRAVSTPRRRRISPGLILTPRASLAKASCNEETPRYAPPLAPTAPTVDGAAITAAPTAATVGATSPLKSKTSFMPTPTSSAKTTLPSLRFTTLAGFPAIFTLKTLLSPYFCLRYVSLSSGVGRNPISTRSLAGSPDLMSTFSGEV